MANPTPILIGGSVAIDNVKTPTAEAVNLLGGSASYAAIAASYYSPSVHLVGIIGKDFPQEHIDLLESRGINLDGLEKSEGDSFFWSGEYHENMNDRTTKQVAVNVLEDWKVSVPSTAAGIPIIVLANMAPDNQLELLNQCTAEKRFVVADTMDLWISIANESLHKVLKRIDLLVINESEARDFVGTSNLIVAGKRLLEKGPQHVVIKLGEFGAILFSSGSDAEPQLFRCAAIPLTEVADPTGAGDSFLGALAGYLAATTKSEFLFDDIRQAVVQGTVVASFTCEAFSTRRLQTLTQQEIADRLTFLKSITHWP
ncbi:carbohydrate kinase [Luteolibacter pohnpeiensis]|uniref:Carbohydrate kinase n=1 Tax=Luteolibacter pohnpeiensis TaxID=454153 RepID=A0A934SC82_9BACT|nr:PfkB family carbohydrate kinase [Luteolibacter pohnpeiensis]MBK1883497.1 carbohydrate kinase [Luteolibacter pohnpeiensis]